MKTIINFLITIFYYLFPKKVKIENIPKQLLKETKEQIKNSTALKNSIKFKHRCFCGKLDTENFTYQKYLRNFEKAHIKAYLNGQLIFKFHDRYHKVLVGYE